MTCTGRRAPGEEMGLRPCSAPRLPRIERKNRHHTAGGSELWFDPRASSDKAFLKARSAISRAKSAHPELKTVIHGFCGDTPAAVSGPIVMTTLHPDRVVAVWMQFRHGTDVSHSCRVYSSGKLPKDALAAIPMMCNPGVRGKAQWSKRKPGAEDMPHGGGKNEGAVARLAGHLQRISRQGRADWFSPGRPHRPRVRGLSLFGHSVLGCLSRPALTRQGRQGSNPQADRPEQGVAGARCWARKPSLPPPTKAMQKKRSGCPTRPWPKLGWNTSRPALSATLPRRRPQPTCAWCPRVTRAWSGNYLGGRGGF